MKKILVAFMFFLFLCSTALFAQTVKIIDMRGNVQMKKDEKATWQEAKLNIILGKQSEIKTDAASECTLSFDDELKNILTIKEDSQIKIENLKPANINLPKGRVFSLIDDIAKVEKFEIRTPTAVAGVRGTGESVEFSQGCANVKCFENDVYVEGFDSQNNMTGQEMVSNGSGVKVCEGGTFGKQFKLSGRDFFEWENFMGSVDDLRDNTFNGGGDSESLNNARDERRFDYGNDMLENRRREEENRGSGDSSSGSGNGDSEEQEERGY